MQHISCDSMDKVTYLSAHLDSEDLQRIREYLSLKNCVSVELFHTDENHLILCLEDCPWDTHVTGLKTARVMRAFGNFDVKPNSFIPILIERLKELGFEYLIWRISTDLFQFGLSLQREGLVVVDSIVEFKKKVIRQHLDADISIAQPEDCANIGQLSQIAFTLSRFHSDPVFSKDIADKAYYEWAVNCCRGVAADICFTYKVEEQIQGFISCKIIRENTGSIGLIGVDSTQTGQGIGQKLVFAIENWCAEQELNKIFVMTQSSNAPAIRLYTKCGFKVVDNHQTLRWTERK